MKIDKSKLVASNGNPLTQAMFLEHQYDYKIATFTLGEEDKEVDGKTFISLKRLYLEYEDPTEYSFAKEYLYSWGQWRKLTKTKFFKKYIDEWRDELELRIRSQAIRDIIDMTASDGSFQAAKWLSDRGWDKRKAGRPSKSEIERETRIQQNLNDEFDEDYKRLSVVK